MELIDKDAVVAEIERYKHKADERLKIKNRSLAEERKDIALQNLCGNLLNFLSIFEVREVDLANEVSKWLEENCDDAGYFNQLDLAKHFFELGLKAQKGE